MAQYLPLTGAMASYYSNLLSKLSICSVNVVLHTMKGKCLIATKPIAKGEVLLEEQSLCVSLNLDSYMKDTAKEVCGGCLATVGENAFACPAVNCGDRFCDESCFHRAAYHRAICNARPRLFRLDHWTHARVDYTDTAMLASKILTSVIERSRREKISIEEAWIPWSYFMSAPLQGFYFGYLVNGPEHKAAWGHLDVAGRRRLMRKAFRRYRTNPSADRGVIEANATDPFTKDEMVNELCDILREGVGNLSDEELLFLTPEKVSNTLGLVLLNSQTRYPRIEGLDGQSNFAIGSCFNHSCSPNVLVKHNYEGKLDDRMYAVALRDIMEGEECMISYLDESKTLEERQWYLFDHYKFDCSCVKCMA
eukprot:PhF_6_TR5100/c0_g1_i1/m.7182